MEPISGDALRGHLETMALASLEKGEAHGFEILRRLTEAGSGALKLKDGSLYPALYRLEQAGLISRGRDAQWRPCRIETAPLQQLDGWVERYRRLWDKNFDRMDAYLAELQKGAPDGRKQ